MSASARWAACHRGQNSRAYFVPQVSRITVVMVRPDWNRPGSAGMTVFAAVLFGALAGFLVHNFHPAKVFMGDTGSLFLGGAVCGMAFALDLPLILILVGIIYIAETLSDIIQVVYFKATHGKRIFRMAPLHHHFEMGGWSEAKLFFVFSGITLVCCVAAFFGVVGRFPVL